MQVRINDLIVDYQPDFKPNSSDWKVKLRDAFRIAKIGGVDCFVKRFAEKPSAYDLLISLKGRPVVNMPMIYDLVTNTENSKTIYYLFLERIEGSTLKEHIQQHKRFDIMGVVGGVLESLKFIHSNGYWFSDLNEENIYCGADGSYLLIDVDSCYSNHIKPGTDVSQPGGMPGAAQEHANVVMLFYKQILGNTGFLYQDIEGKSLNCLQILALAAKLKVFLDTNKSNPKTAYVNKKLYKDLHYFLLNRNENYCKTIFFKALNNSLQYSLVTEMAKFITGENVTPQNNVPIIDHFNASDFNIYSGANTTLLWSVKNAGEVSISNESVTLLPSGPPVSSLTVKPFKNETYVLTATNEFGQKAVKTLQINVILLPGPEIKHFTAHKYKVKKGSPVKLSWLAENVSSISINGKSFEPGTISTTVYPMETSGYVIIAENKSGEKVTRQLTIRVTKANWWWLALPILVAIFTIWQVIVRARYDKLVSAGDDQFSSGYYQTAIDDYRAANGMADFVLFGDKPNLYSKITDARGGQFKNEGEAMLKAGDILSPPDKPDSASAYNCFKNAAHVLPGDTLVQSRIIFCQKDSSARAYRLNANLSAAATAYQEVVDYGLKTNVPKAAIDAVKKVITTLTILTIPTASLVDQNTSYLSDVSTPGLQVVCNIKVSNLKNVDCKGIIYFYGTSGEKLIDASAPISYRAADNQVCTSAIFKPGDDEVTFKFTFFMPKDVLQITCGKFSVIIYKSDNTHIWTSDLYNFCEN